MTLNSALKISADRQRVETTTYKGEFWKPCPGTTAGYYCCGYQIITPVTGCGMYCRYCVLQAYFAHQHQTIYENFSDLEQEVHQKMVDRKGVIRFGTGEFGDSLYLDHISTFSVKIASLLEPYDAVVEFKTKSTNIGNLHKIKNPNKVIIGFSLNTPTMINLLEQGTAPLKERLSAARECVNMGLNVAFHFDPMFWYNEWEREYRSVVKLIFDYIKDPSKIAWVSMGGFRCMPSLKTQLKNNGNSHFDLFSSEMINGADGKLRYFRPLRIAFYTAMCDEFKKSAPDITLYLCMESPEVWKASGMKDEIPNGLVSYLDNRAKEILGIKR